MTFFNTIPSSPPDPKIYKFKVPELKKGLTKNHGEISLKIGSRIQDRSFLSYWTTTLGCAALSISSEFIRQLDPYSSPKTIVSASIHTVTAASFIRSLYKTFFPGLETKAGRERAVHWCAKASLSDLARTYTKETIINFGLLEKISMEVESDRPKLYQAVGKLSDAFHRIQGQKAALEDKVESKYQENGGKFEAEFKTTDDYDDEDRDGNDNELTPAVLFMKFAVGTYQLAKAWGKDDRELSYKEWKKWKKGELKQIEKQFDKAAELVDESFLVLKKNAVSGLIF